MAIILYHRHCLSYHSRSYGGHSCHIDSQPIKLVNLQAKREATESAAKEAFYREALQELTLFKSRTSASLLQAQEQLQSAHREADAMETTYQTAWDTAQANHSKNTALLAQLSEVWAHLLYISPPVCMCKHQNILGPALLSHQGASSCTYINQAVKTTSCTQRGGERSFMTLTSLVYQKRCHFWSPKGIVNRYCRQKLEKPRVSGDLTILKRISMHSTPSQQIKSRLKEMLLRSYCRSVILLSNTTSQGKGRKVTL